jgi:hypothetical protein
MYGLAPHALGCTELYYDYAWPSPYKDYDYRTHSWMIHTDLSPAPRLPIVPLILCAIPSPAKDE